MRLETVPATAAAAPALKNSRRFIGVRFAKTRYRSHKQLNAGLPPDSVLALGPDMTGHVKALYRLANLLEAEGRLREIDGRLADALQSYLC